MPGLRLVISGTDTGVGKTFTTSLLAAALRGLGRQVWLHKPAACGGWDGQSSEDGRALRAVCGDGQDPRTVCPLEYPEPAAPHLAAAAAGRGDCTVATMAHAVRALHLHAAERDVVIEGIGGWACPLEASGAGLAEVLHAAGIASVVRVVLVTRCRLGTLNHSLLCVRAIRTAGIGLAGLLLNQHPAPPVGLAEERAATELPRLANSPLLAVLDAGMSATLLTAKGQSLARALAVGETSQAPSTAGQFP